MNSTMQSSEEFIMLTRLATIEDLAQIKAIYKEIISSMEERNLHIWDECYPCEVFSDDIAQHRLYVLEEKGEILAAFALCDTPDNIDCIAWEKKDARALYLYRFGVKAKNMRQGIGKQALEAAAVFARELGAEYLRLLVVDTNKPAINFYAKNGYQQAPGLRDEPLGHTVLKEYGFEITLRDANESS